MVPMETARHQTTWRSSLVSVRVRLARDRETRGRARARRIHGTRAQRAWHLRMYQSFGPPKVGRDANFDEFTRSRARKEARREALQ